MKGMLCEVLRRVGTDCTNGGITSKVKHVVLIGPGIPEIFAPSATAPALLLVVRSGLAKNGGKYYHAEPVDRPEGKAGPMFGGNYVTTSDSRMLTDHPIPVHDRFDTWEDYDLLSR